MFGFHRAINAFDKSFAETNKYTPTCKFSSKRRKRTTYASRNGILVGRRVHFDANDGHGVDVALSAQSPGRLDQRHAQCAQQTAVRTTSERHSIVLPGTEFAHQVKKRNRRRQSFNSGSL